MYDEANGPIKLWFHAVLFGQLKRSPLGLNLDRNCGSIEAEQVRRVKYDAR